MFKKIFTLCGLVALFSSSVGVMSLSSCGSGSSEETQEVSGVMTLSDFSSGRSTFIIRTSQFIFFYITADGGDPVGLPTNSNEVLVNGTITTDGTTYPMVMKYTTDEKQQPDGIPQIATLNLSFANPSDTSITTLIRILFSDNVDTSDNPAFVGEPIQLTFNFPLATGTLKSTIEGVEANDTDEGNIIIGDGRATLSQETAPIIIRSTSVQ